MTWRAIVPYRGVAALEILLVGASPKIKPITQTTGPRAAVDKYTHWPLKLVTMAATAISVHAVRSMIRTNRRNVDGKRALIPFEIMTISNANPTTSMMYGKL